MLCPYNPNVQSGTWYTRGLSIALARSVYLCLAFKIRTGLLIFAYRADAKIFHPHQQIHPRKIELPIRVYTLNTLKKRASALANKMWYIFLGNVKVKDYMQV